MSFDSVPSKAEVMSWNPPQLADYLRKMDLGGCDKVIMKCGMNGRRFLSMTDNDVQKFPKIHTPLISKICKEINKKEEKRGFFPKRTVQKYPEPVAVPEDVGWDSEEFDQSDDDYESPDSGGGEGSGGDYESPAEEDPQQGGGDSDNDYEPPPSEPPDELPRQICPAKPLGDSDYIDNTRNRGVSVKVPNNQPPVPPQRPGPGPPQVNLRSTLPGPHPPRREQSPQRPFRLPNQPAPGPSAPQVDRRKKPTTLERGLPGLPAPPERESPLAERKPFGVGERTTPPRGAFRPPAIEKPPEPQRLHKPPIPGPGVSRRVSSVSQHTATSRPFSQDHRNDVSKSEGASFSSNTFPLSVRTLPPRPGVPSTPFDSLPPNRPASSSLPSRLQPSVTVQRSSSRGQADRCPRVPLPPQRPSVPEPQPESEQDLNPMWYVGQATRADAEGNLRHINQDGAFLVRDSSKGSPTQPYTLMVLYQDKVYNIQIRYNSDEGVFLLGTGFKSSENFPGVNDIIKYHMKMPLLLIDAKDRRSAQQRQCLLTHPAGY
ncbi:lymphocyte cytosolic protein 2-like isoform X2 [Anguilla rostrata]|uniref:lymphocyte cytosolic protein 2-like isoform X2 n=1 Tax=Anguilla rostrata TaxID=7938 RepID=UPI0030CFE67F